VTKAELSERDEAIARLRKELNPGDVLYTIVRHVSRSGMSRSISVCRPVKATDGRGRDSKATLEIESLDYWVARVVKERIDQKNGGVVQTGAGMDMGFHLVYNLGRYLWPNGTPKPHGKRNGQPDSDGGYALKHRWL
jgi:hypothetical protein